MLRDQIEGKNDSWAIRWYASAFVNDKHTLFSRHSLVYDIGNDGSGTNFSKSDILDVEISNKPISIFEENIEEFREVRGQVESYLKYINAGALKIIYKIMKKKLNFKYRFANKVNFID